MWSMDFTKFDNSVFIIKDAAKENIIKNIQKSGLINIKIITLSELKKKYYFDYTNKTIYEVSKNYNINSEIAKIYLENLYYIKDIKNEKIEFLKDVYIFLLEKKLLIFNPMFHSYLKNKKIVLIDLDDVDKFYENIFKKLKDNNEIIVLNTFNNITKKKIYKAKDKEDEIAFVASSICNLIKSGIDINKIKLANVKNDYLFTIKKIFKLFNIPITLLNTNTKGTILLKKFNELYKSDMSLCFEELKEYIHSQEDKKIYDNLIKVVNQYAWCDDYNDVKELLLEDANNIEIQESKLKNSVTLIDFENDCFSDDYIFLINFNQGIIPVNAKDEDYLDNNTKKALSISDTNEINKKRILNVQNRIRGAENLIVTYSESDLNGKLYISTAYNENDFEEYAWNVVYNSSNAYNKIKLVSAKDEFKKFGTISENLKVLSYNYPNFSYETYKNDFNGLDKDKMFNYLNKKLILSYSSLDNYYKCAYRYYLEHILNLNEFESRFETLIGNIFHKVLSKCYNGNFNFDYEYDKACNEEEYEYNKKEKYFLEKLKTELLKIINVIKEQDKYSLLKNKLFESKVVVPISKNPNVEFKGFIDKIMYDEIDNERIAIIVDYKTGDTNINLQNIEYGLSLQLPIYAYLLKNINSFNNVKIGGFYLQKLFDDENLKLSGYTNSDLNILEKVDTTYRNSLLINGLKVGKNGLYQSAKVLSDIEIEELCDKISDKIKDAARNILSSKFEINPKELNNSNIGCKYCKFKSICYMKNADIKKIGGERDAKMDK